jgi:hypothetical protein
MGLPADKIVSSQDCLPPKDDGKRTKYGTGALRSDRTGRGRYDLIAPFALERLAKQYEHGASQKGGKDGRNWERGFPISRAICSAMSHINDYLKGDRSEDHLAAASWQLFCTMEFEERIKLGFLPAQLADTPKLEHSKKD